MTVGKKNRDQELIDRMIDWRRINRPRDQSDIKTNLAPDVIHRALGLPRPMEGAKYPDSVLYRGYRILGKVNAGKDERGAVQGTEKRAQISKQANPGRWDSV
jgi:hypothetical protein